MDTNPSDHPPAPDAILELHQRRCSGRMQAILKPVVRVRAWARDRRFSHRKNRNRLRCGGKPKRASAATLGV